MTTITIDRAVVEQAVEALNFAHSSHNLMLLSDPPQEAWKVHRVDEHLQKSITALREALNAPQPVNSSAEYERGFIDGMQKQMQSSVDKAVNRLAAQPEPVAAITDALIIGTGVTRIAPENFYAQPQPAPAATMWQHTETGRTAFLPPYTAPPRREWVDLTDADIEAICDMARPREVSIRIAQQKLKERNHDAR